MASARAWALYSIISQQQAAQKKAAEQAESLRQNLRESYFTEEYAGFDSGEKKKRASLLGNDMANMMGN